MYFCYIFKKIFSIPPKLLSNFIFFLNNIFLFKRLLLKRLTLREYIQLSKYIFKKYIFLQRIPFTLIFGLTYDCQCKCVHCAISDYCIDIDKEMSLAEIYKILDTISRLGIPFIKLFGGEPTLRKEKMFNIVEYASKKGIIVSIDTNGEYLDRQDLIMLKKQGLNFLQVSLDNQNSYIHDKLRGRKGIYQKCLQTMEHCRLQGIPFIISTYATKISIESGDIERMIYLGKHRGSAAVKILLPILSGKFICKDELLLDDDYRERLFQIIHSNRGFVYLESPTSIKGNIKRCASSLEEIIYVSPYGDVQPCYAIPISFGNIRENNLTDILSRMRKSNIFRNFSIEGCPMDDKAFRSKILSISKNNNISFPVFAELLNENKYI